MRKDGEKQIGQDGIYRLMEGGEDGIRGRA